MASAAPARTDDLLTRFRARRALTIDLATPLSDADATVQSMPDASPAKWHLAHTTWFFETFVLRDHVPGYEPFDAHFAYLFNSYYEAEGARHARPQRGMLTRPSLDRVRAYRAHVDAAVEAALPSLPAAAHNLIDLGCHHEAQHEELLLTDLLHLMSLNPTNPAVWPRTPQSTSEAATLGWVDGRSGLVEIGHNGTGFAFDCEGPRHRVHLTPHALADRLVTNGEWQDFVEAGGYRDAALWLSDGWAWVQANGIEAPLHWRDDWQQFGLDGLTRRDPAAPVAHISYYEADAYARWTGFRLPTESEWEAAAATVDPASGNQLDVAGPVRTLPADGSGLTQMFGDVWQWTASAFLPHPGFRAAEGAVGEYNGKFMSGQMVLKGASCATPRGTSRASYRNFFPPAARWQFTGLRLARDFE
ncbi:MAG TPA: ergothioneine biosynthesis protein EgtB [Sphingomonas sp.]|jgi:ergothioneine biosynthesis protein EgtB|nr:ergothioneine biosynthesis protein EgtB [Sphingomonas sp.]